MARVQALNLARKPGAVDTIFRMDVTQCDGAVPKPSHGLLSGLKTKINIKYTSSAK